MILDREVVFILGAGASKPYGFPLAYELGREALRWLDKRSIRDPLHKIGIDDARIEEFIHAFDESRCGSIDHFLQTRSEKYMDVGVAMLASILIAKEDPQKVRNPERGDCWYGWLLDNLGDTADEFDASPLTLATFNYDRSAEQVLIRGLHTRYGIPVEQATKMVVKKVIHLYGDLGAYPGSGKTDEEAPFATTTTSLRLRLAMDRIALIRRGAKPTPPFDRVRERIRKATRIKFLGFGYDKINVGLLGDTKEWTDWGGSGKGISGTLMGKSPREATMIVEMLGGHLRHRDQPVYDFLRHDGI